MTPDQEQFNSHFKQGSKPCNIPTAMDVFYVSSKCGFKLRWKKPMSEGGNVEPLGTKTKLGAPHTIRCKTRRTCGRSLQAVIADVNKTLRGMVRVFPAQSSLDVCVA